MLAPQRQFLAGRQRRGFASGGDVTVTTSGAAPTSGVPAISSNTAANSSVAPFTGNGYETLAPATAIAPVSNPVQPYSSPITNVPMSALTGGAGSNGVIAPVNNQGIPQGTPGPANAPKVTPNTAFAPPQPATPAAASSAPAIGPNETLAQLFPQSSGGIPQSLSQQFGIYSQANPGANGISGATTFSQLPSQFQTAVQNAVGSKRGGAIKPRHLAVGGIPTSEALDPYSTRMSEREMQGHPEGLFGSTGAGRTDVHNILVPTGSYVMPSDVVSGLSEGNTLGGAAVIDRMMHSNPYGIESSGGRKPNMGPPRAIPQRIQPLASEDLNMEKRGGPIRRASGGQVQPKPNLVPIVVAGGEVLLHPDTIIKKFGSLKKGHAVLDKFVKDVRAKTVKETSRLPGPKK